jgi:hypothetical protein
LQLKVTAPAAIGFRWRTPEGQVVVCGYEQVSPGALATYAVQCAGVKTPGVLLPSVALEDGFKYEFEVQVP